MQNKGNKSWLKSRETMSTDKEKETLREKNPLREDLITLSLILRMETPEVSDLLRMISLLCLSAPCQQLDSISYTLRDHTLRELRELKEQILLQGNQCTRTSKKPQMKALSKMLLQPHQESNHLKNLRN